MAQRQQLCIKIIYKSALTHSKDIVQWIHEYLLDVLRKCANLHTSEVWHQYEKKYRRSVGKYLLHQSGVVVGAWRTPSLSFVEYIIFAPVFRRDTPTCHYVRLCWAALNIAFRSQKPQVNNDVTATEDRSRGAPPTAVEARRVITCLVEAPFVATHSPRQAEKRLPRRNYLCFGRSIGSVLSWKIVWNEPCCESFGNSKPCERNKPRLKIFR